MAWTIEYDSHTLRVLKGLDRNTRREILDYMDHRVAMAENPRNFGKPLVGDKFGLWRYKVRDYRIICQFEDRNLVVLVIDVGPERDLRRLIPVIPLDMSPYFTNSIAQSASNEIRLTTSATFRSSPQVNSRSMEHSSQ